MNLTNRNTASFERYGTNLRIYDNGGSSFDRYTILPARYDQENKCPVSGLWEGVGASECPESPNGFGQTCTAQAGPHLGKRLAISQLPGAVVRFIKSRFPEYFIPRLAASTN